MFQQYFSVIVQGYAYDPDCMYINGSGRDYYEFFIQLNRCGTLGKNAIHEKSRENPTVSHLHRQLSVFIFHSKNSSSFFSYRILCGTQSLSNIIR